jgi:hypothetical protein
LTQYQTILVGFLSSKRSPTVFLHFFVFPHAPPQFQRGSRFYFYQPFVFFPPAHPPPPSPFLSPPANRRRLSPRKLIRHEKLPQAPTAFLDAMPPAKTACMAASKSTPVFLALS